MGGPVIPQGLVERPCLGGRLHVQFIAQGAPADLELGQGLAAPPQPGQQPHDRPMPLLLPRIDLHLPLRPMQRPLQIPLLLVIIHQTAQRVRGQAVQPLPLQQDPFIPGAAVGQGKPGQERPGVVADGLFQQGCFLLGIRRVRNRHGPIAGSCSCRPASLRLGPIAPQRGWPGDRWRSVPARQKGLAQAIEGLAQALAGAGLVIFGPEQAAQHVPAEGSVMFTRQIRQQRAHLVVVKGDGCLVV